MNQPSVKKNYIYQLLYEILVLISPFITTPYVSRVLGADGIGIYSFTSSIMAYFTMFAALGTQGYGAREIARHRNNKFEISKLFFEIEAMKIVTSVICMMVWVCVIIFNHRYRHYFIALAPLLISTMLDISWFYTGLEQTKYIVIRNAACKVIGIICIFVFVKDSNDLIVYILIHSLAMLIGNLSMWTYLPRQLVKVKITTLNLQTHLRETFVYFIPAIAASIYTVLDKTLIGLITGSSYQNGFYEQATKIINILKTIAFVSVNAVMGARISYLFAEKKYNEIRQRISKSIDFILLLGYGCLFGIISVSRNFVPIFFGNGYEEVTNLLYLMAPLIIIIGISNCLGSQYFTPSGQRKLSAKIIIIGSLINLCFNLVLIPKYGARGATIASIIAETVIAIVYIKLSSEYLTFKIIWLCSWKRLLAGILMLLCTCAVGGLKFCDYKRVVVQIMTGIIVYGVSLFVMRDEMLFSLAKNILYILKRGKGTDD